MYIYIYTKLNIYNIYIIYAYIRYVGGKHSINGRTMFSLNLHLEEMEPGFHSLHLDMVRTELRSHIPLKRAKYYIPLQSVCCLFVT